MADLIDIEFGDQRIRVPAWATESTLEAMLKYNEIAARALNKLVGVDSDGKKVYRIQEQYFKKITEDLAASKKIQKDTLDQDKKDRKAEKKESSDSGKLISQTNNKLDENIKKQDELNKNISSFTKESNEKIQNLINVLTNNTKEELGSDNASFYKSFDVFAKYLDAASTTVAVHNILLTNLSDKITLTVISFDELIKKINESVGSMSQLGGTQYQGPINNNFDNVTFINMIEKLLNERNPPDSPKKADDTKAVKTFIEIFENALKKVKKNKTPATAEPFTREELLKLRRTRKPEGFSDEFFTEYKKFVKKLSEGIEIPDSVIKKFEKDIEKFPYYANDAGKNLKSIISKIGNDLSATSKAVFSGSLSEFSNSIGSIITGLGQLASSIPFLGTIIAGATAASAAVLGYFISSLENQAKAITEMVNVGAGVGVGMEQLRIQAGGLGLGLDSFAKIVNDNASAMIVFGGSVREGSQRFAMLGAEVKDNLMKKFNQFGMSNTELSSVMLEEIDLRRRLGQDETQITRELSDGMEQLLMETTAMANLQGQDRRDMMRARLERSKDAVIGSYAGTLSGDELANYLQISAMATEKFGEAGKTLANALQYGAATGVGIQGNMELQKLIAAAAGTPLADELRNFANTVQDSFGSMSVEQFNDTIDTGLGAIGEAYKKSDLTTTRQLAIYGGDIASSAANVLSFGMAVSGINDSLNDNTAETAKLTEAMQTDEILSLPASLETLSNTLNTIALSSMMGVAGTTPEDISKFIQNMDRSFKNFDEKTGQFTGFKSISDLTNEALYGGPVSMQSANIIQRYDPAYSSQNVNLMGTAMGSTTSKSIGGLSSAYYANDIKEIIDSILTDTTLSTQQKISDTQTIVNEATKLNVDYFDKKLYDTTSEIVDRMNYLNEPSFWEKMTGMFASNASNNTNTTANTTTASATVSKEDSVPYIQETNRLLGTLIRKYDESIQ